MSKKSNNTIAAFRTDTHVNPAFLYSHTNSVSFLHFCKRPAPVRDSRPAEGPQQVYRDLGFPLFEARDTGFKSKIRARFGIESMCGRWDAKNNPQDYGIERNCGSGLRD